MSNVAVAVQPSTENKHPSTEKKHLWYGIGEEYERQFIEDICPKISLKAMINPKKEKEPWACDLLVNGAPADLKRQTEPFYTASKYGFDAQYTVTLNQKDIDRYAAAYDPRVFNIYFWVTWEHSEKFNQKINRMQAVAVASMLTVLNIAESSDAKWHYYQRRGEGDPNRNATNSLLIDIRRLGLVYVNTFGRPLGVFCL